MKKKNAKFIQVSSSLHDNQLARYSSRASNGLVYLQLQEASNGLLYPQL